MKKIIFTTAIIIAIISFSFSVHAWDDCPFGFEDEAYPGTCWRYIDKNNDGICDHSQSEPEEETVSEDLNSNSIIQNKKNSSNFPYLLVLSFLIVLVIILILKLLQKEGKISKGKEKILLNILLLIFFLPSAITGVVLLLMTDIEILKVLGQSFTSLHNISSMFFIWISGYHIIWHTTYYVKGTKHLLNRK